MYVIYSECPTNERDQYRDVVWCQTDAHHIAANLRRLGYKVRIEMEGPQPTELRPPYIALKETARPEIITDIRWYVRDTRSPDHTHWITDIGYLNESTARMIASLLNDKWRRYNEPKITKTAWSEQELDDIPF